MLIIIIFLFRGIVKGLNESILRIFSWLKELKKRYYNNNNKSFSLVNNDEMDKIIVFIGKLIF